MHYRIRIQGHLDPGWQDRFWGLCIEQQETGTTLLSGILPDQAALHGVLLQITRLGLVLLSLETSEAPGGQEKSVFSTQTKKTGLSRLSYVSTQGENNMNIDGAVMLITGASSGIGAATARAASRDGARLVLAARREERIAQLADELREAIAVRCDVTDADQVAKAVQTALETFGRIDVLVNNAGQGLQGQIDEIDPDDFRAILDLNLVAPLVTMQAVLPIMRKQGVGSIVNVSSGTILSVIPGTGAYSASKAGLATLSAVARAEPASTGIAVSTMYPFITATEFLESIRADHESAARLESSNSLQPQKPDQVAEAILDLIRTGAERADLVPEQYGGTYRG